MIRFALCLMLCCSLARAASVERLRCEYLDSPLGVDAANPRLSWEMRSDRRGEKQTAYRVVVTSGDHTCWDTGRENSDESVAVAYAGERLMSGGQYAWKVMVWDRDGKATEYSRSATWEMGLLDPAEWHGKWIGAAAPTGSPAPMLRRTFEITGKVKRARAYVCGLGYYELRLNGRKVGDRMLEPAFTNYDKRVLYSTYDVTEALRPGKNAIGAILGTGWYDMHTNAEWHFEEASWRDRPKLLVELRVEYEDGKTDRVVTDDAWKVSTGPITFDSVYCGENYDALLEKNGWDTPDYDDGKWDTAKVATAPKGKLLSQQMPPIRVVETLTPVKISEPKPGVFIVDFGQNFAGLPQLSVDGPAGTTLSMRCGERLDADGTLDTKNIETFVKRHGNKQFQEDHYTLKGGGRETWSPRFTYHGFQYVQVTGFPGTPTPDNFRGLVMHTDLPRTGSFTCSNELLNKIYRAGIWSYLNNAYGYPTDCPTREKNGWTGDAHLASQQALLNFDAVPFYEKWVNDIADAQWPEGDVPAIVPTQGWGRGIGPAWDSAYLLIPWYVYQHTGDASILRRHYDGMRRYVDYLTREKAKDGIVSYGLGDWAPYEAQTPGEVTSTGYYFRDAQLIADAARILGKTDDAAKYSDLAAHIASAFNKKFFDAKAASYANGTQTALSCALAQDLVPPDQRPRVLENLLAGIAKRQDHLDTGILGTKYVMDALLAGGRIDVGYRIASQKTLPSWGWWIQDRGATTLFESWKDVDSRDHIMFGDVSRWFTSALAGIQLDPASPGARHVIIRPAVVGDLTSARADYQSVRGRIISDWKDSAGKLELNVTIPANVTATVYVPGTDPAPADAEGVTIEGNRFEVGSGTYRFTATMK